MLQRDHSMLTFETDSIQGAGAILEKLNVCRLPAGIHVYMQNNADSPTEPSIHQGCSPGLDPRRSALQRAGWYLGHGHWCSSGMAPSPTVPGSSRILELTINSRNTDR